MRNFSRWVIGRTIGRESATRLLLALLLLLGGMALIAPCANAAAPAAVVKMTDKPPKFVPLKVTVKVGQTVQWINDAKTLHSVTATPDDAANKADISLPAGAQPFDSGFMQPGATFEYTFTVKGTYKYTCLPHEKDGMNGFVVVK